MKKVVGIILVASAVVLMALIVYSQLINHENALSWFSLFVPVLFIFQGLSYIKTEIADDSSETNTMDNQINEIACDKDKRDALITKLEAMEGEPIIPVLEFFDGNIDDKGSIGCNLYPIHPGIETFRSVFESLLARDDVSAIYAHISEIEPDEESWPYTDCIYVFGTISPDQLERLTTTIEPTEVGESDSFFSEIPSQVKTLNPEPMKVLWWD